MNTDNSSDTTLARGDTNAAHDGAPDKKTTSPSLVRTFVLATIGFAALGMDAVSTFLRVSIERGQQMEEDARKMGKRYQENAKVQAKAAEESRNELVHQAAMTLDENLRALTRVFAAPKPLSQPTATSLDADSVAKQEGQHNRVDGEY